MLIENTYMVMNISAHGYSWEETRKTSISTSSSTIKWKIFEQFEFLRSIWGFEYLNPTLNFISHQLHCMQHTMVEIGNFFLKKHLGLLPPNSAKIRFKYIENTKIYRLFLVNCYLLHVPRLPSQPASTEKDLRGWVIEKKLAWTGLKAHSLYS